MSAIKKFDRKRILQFCSRIDAYYQKCGRTHLPWRKTDDPYHILVSEMMLQQTQVDRVIPKYNAFLSTFPSFQELAKATLAEVYSLWKGLGYNRRAKFLRDTAIEVMQRFDGKLPRTVEQLLTLPGIGPYTARAVYSFSKMGDAHVIETNVRSAIIAHFFQKSRSKISDAQIESVLMQCRPHVTDWYAFNAGLMDYGSSLKRSHNHARKAAVYARQSKFTGSVREVRGEILRLLEKQPRSISYLKLKATKNHPLFEKAITGLVRDAMVVNDNGTISLAL